MELDLPRVTYTPNPPKQRQVLALLALRANRVVPLKAIIEELWDQVPPRSASTTAQTYVYQIRKEIGRFRGAEELLSTVPPGYMLNVGAGQLDLNDFEDLMERARTALDAGNPAQAAPLLHDALRLWRGTALENVSLGPVLSAQVTHLNELRMQALETRITVDLTMGRHREMIGELKELVADHPLNEFFYAQLMRALAKVGRRGEALQVYRSLWRTLRNDLGIEPAVELQELHRSILGNNRPATAMVKPYLSFPSET
ncbi:DNA-binding SARP family transcriptional activator [Kibdelosporangium banguiense]|uniref:DNA-binding SARP family transcriptional activator n=1 Tax=Kibdelosporangium banguiense TaxID=1365924 RepID=A0ABS4TGK3_9PSEU|nr:AfsR/SARP family transcriptional regulator [Kibdelosporangium banguiense]MBP2323150.1 DNA-binding SARP family transcriptional activator [Kibdelosporangium banguiense]